MADTSVEDDMGAAGGGAAAPSCIDARARCGKTSAGILGTSAYAEAFTGEERCCCLIVVCGVTFDCWLSSSSRSRLFEGGLAAGIGRFPAVVRSVSKSLPKTHE